MPAEGLSGLRRARLQLQSLGGGLPRGRRVVAAADEERHEAPVGGLRGEPTKAGDARLGEAPETLLLVPGGLPDDLVDQSAIESPGRQARRDRPGSLEATPERVLRELRREPRVVDEPDLLQPLELGRDVLGVEARAHETRLQLASRPLPDGEQSERAIVEGEPGAHDSVSRPMRAR